MIFAASDVRNARNLLTFESLIVLYSSPRAGSGGLWNTPIGIQLMVPNLSAGMYHR
jgi:hypothetical protein